MEHNWKVIQVFKFFNYFLTRFRALSFCNTINFFIEMEKGDRDYVKNPCNYLGDYGYTLIFVGREEFYHLCFVSI